MHTPTPWKKQEYNIEDLQNGRIATFELSGWRLANAEANIKRIVACVNACEPFKDPLESIPKLLVEVEALRDRVKELETQSSKKDTYSDYLEQKDNEARWGR